MSYADLRDFLAQLEAGGELRRLGAEVSPQLEMTEICDRLLRAGGPAVLFERPKGHSSPVLGNLFGTVQRGSSPSTRSRMRERSMPEVNLTCRRRSVRPTASSTERSPQCSQGIRRAMSVCPCRSGVGRRRCDREVGVVAVLEQGVPAFAVLIGLSAGPIQASSRTLLARLCPPEKTTEFFGFFAFSGKITAFMGLPKDYGETIQGQRYLPGQEFKPHNDWFYTDQDYWKNERKRGGQRSWTAMAFLNKVEEGGQTHFVEVGARIEPKSLEITGIKLDSPLRNAIPEREMLQQLSLPIRKEMKKTDCQRAILVGHNSFFDLSFLNAAIDRSDYKRSPFHPFSSFDTATLGGLAFGQTVLSRAVQAAGIELPPPGPGTVRRPHQKAPAPAGHFRDRRPGHGHGHIAARRRDARIDLYLAPTLRKVVSSFPGIELEVTTATST